MKLRLMGYADMSTLDLPGRLSVVVFLQGCNLRCPWCQNPDGVSKDGGKAAETEDVIHHIKGLQPLVDTVMLSGGEVLLQPMAGLEILKAAGGLGLYRAAETNGTNPRALEGLLPYLDFIAIDVKAPLSDQTLYDRATGGAGALARNVKESLILALNSKADVEVRTTVVPTINDNGTTMARLTADIATAGSRQPSLRLQQFRNHRTLDPSFQKLPIPSREKLLEFARIAKQQGLKDVRIFTVERGLEKV